MNDKLNNYCQKIEAKYEKLKCKVTDEKGIIEEIQDQIRKRTRLKVKEEEQRDLGDIDISKDNKNDEEKNETKYIFQSEVVVKFGEETDEEEQSKD